MIHCLSKLSLLLGMAMAEEQSVSGHDSVLLSPFPRPPVGSSDLNLHTIFTFDGKIRGPLKGILKS